MKKLLHERLRECEYSRYSWSCNTKDLASIIGEDTDCRDQCSECRKRIYNALADEIERYYIPRPRFEDGEPVGEGDETEAGTVYSIAVYDNGDFTIYDASMNVLYTDLSDSIKRPQPKVLDADGIEINLGDTVWDKQGNKLEVKEIDPSDDPEYQEHLVWCGAYRCGCKWWNIASQLTHKEPDSLNKLLVDMMEDDHMCGTSYIPRLSALIERGA